MRRLLAAAAAALVLAACGGDGAGRYDDQVAQIRQAVEAGDRDGALASLDALGTSAAEAHAAGDVSDDELAELATLLEQARAQLDQQLPPAPTTTTPSTTSAPPPAPAAEPSGEDRGDDDDKDKDEGKGKGKGRGGDDGGDDDDD